ncbi:hypothetical protein PANI_CDS0062 [Maribacter phage Panino]
MKIESELSDGDYSKCPQCEKKPKECNCPIRDFFNWEEPEKVKCDECFEKFSPMVIIKMGGVPLCPTCFKQNQGFGS